MIEIVTSNLLDAKEKYICHICNCVSHSAAGVAKQLFLKYPYSNDYVNRKSVTTPGTINIKGNGKDQRYIVNLFAQYYPGKSKYENSLLDGIMARERFFSECLTLLSYTKNLESIAMPFNIGCGLAGGNWERYYSIIEKFAIDIHKSQGAIVKLYKLEEQE